jgi:hypothetical protein
VQTQGAWETTQGEGVTVAVIDTGVGEHPVFEGKDVQPGFSVYSDEPDGRLDSEGHGTAIAAGVLLVAPKATIMPVRFYTGVEVGFAGTWGEGEREAFRKAVDDGADILVLPWSLDGISELSEADLEPFQYAIDKGAVIVASAGNDPDSEVTVPAAIPGVVAVTGTDRSGNVMSAQVTTGPDVALAGPADLMTVPLPQTTSLGDSELYGEVYGGTSMAGAFVAGVAALTRSAHSDLDASNVIQRILQTAGEGSGTSNEDTGYGLVNADQAVNAEGIETVEENPLGYPLGEPGASGATPDDDSSEGSEPGAESDGPSVAAEGNKESNLSTIIVVAAAVVLVGAAIAVWLVLRGRGRKVAAATETGAFSPAPGGFQQPVAPQQQYGPPMGGGQAYGGPPPSQQGYSSPPRGQQGFNPPPGSGEAGAAPWRPSDPNRQ